MKIQRSTWVLVGIALLLGGTVLLTQTQQNSSNRPANEQNDAARSPVFAFDEADIVALDIETRTLSVSFEQDDDGFWQMVAPEAVPAEEAAIAFLLSRLTTDGLVNTTTVAPGVDLAEFGLEVPFATVNLTLADGAEHVLILGDADFSGQNYYALIDPANFPPTTDTDIDTVAIVTENILNGVDRPLEEWQATDADAEATNDADNAADESDAAAEEDAESTTGGEAASDADNGASDTDIDEDEDSRNDAGETEENSEASDAADENSDTTEEDSDAESETPESGR